MREEPLETGFDGSTICVYVSDYAYMTVHNPFGFEGEVTIVNVETNYLDGKGKGDLRALINAFEELKCQAKEKGYTALYCEAYNGDGRGASRTKSWERAGFTNNGHGFLHMYL